MKNWLGRISESWRKLDGKIQKNKKWRIIAVLGLMVLVFFGYFLYSLSIEGPVTISDELGYLTKALALSGIFTDTASSYYGGYSLLLLPAFVISHDPDFQWRLVMLINALMWSLSSGLLYYVIKKLLPSKSCLTICAICLISMVYPGFVVMGSFSYATSGFVLILMLSVACLLKSGFRHNIFLYGHSLLVGYLFWVHPLGLVYVFVSIIILALKILSKRNWMNILPLALSIAFAIFYYSVVHPWFNHVMTPTGLETRNHYNEFWQNIPSLIFTIDYWLHAVLMFFGQMSFLLISTFGMFAYCIGWLMEGFGKGLQRWLNGLRNDNGKIIMLMMLATIIIVALVEALYFPANTYPYRLSELMYGRYVEMYALFIIAFGLTLGWKRKPAIYSCYIVIITAICLSIFINDENTIQYFPWTLDRNMASLWPVGFFKSTNILGWFAVGCLGILTVNYFRKTRARLLIVIIPVLVYSSVFYTYYHVGSFSPEARRKVMIEIVNHNYPSGCVGVDENYFEKHGVLSFSSFAFRMRNHTLVRMSPRNWLEKCQGPFLTYDSSIYRNHKDITTVAMDNASGLRLLMRKDKVDMDFVPTKIDNMFYIGWKEKPAEVVIGKFFSWSADRGNPCDTEVGECKGGYLRTTNNEGNLLVGPKTNFDRAGKYRLRFDALYAAVDDRTMIKVLSNNGEEVHLLLQLSKLSNSKDCIFQLINPVDDLQVIMYVGEDSVIQIGSYVIESVSL